MKGVGPHSDGKVQIRRSNWDTLGIISHISLYKIFCDPPLEPSHRDGSNEGSQHMFFFEKIRKSIFELSSITPLI